MHARMQELKDPRGNHHSAAKKLKNAKKVKKAKKKLKKVKKVEKLRETKSHGQQDSQAELTPGQQDSQAELTPSPLRWSNPYFHEKTSKNRVALKLRNAEKLKKATREAVEAKHLETKLMKPPTAFEAEFQSDVESEAEFRSWSEELQKELPANGGGGEETSQEEAFRLCREDAARFKDVEFFKADAAADRSLFLNTAWLALARSAGLEEWLACARSEELFCECCLR